MALDHQNSSSLFPLSLVLPRPKASPYILFSLAINPIRISLDLGFGIQK
jgi:hypothetical protein